MKKAPNFLLALLSIVVLLSSCSKNDDPTPSMPPTIVSITPSDKSIGVDKNEVIDVTFSKTPSLKTQNGDGIKLLDGDGNIVQSEYRYMENNEVRCTPSLGGMFSNEVYRINIKDATSIDGSIFTEFNSSLTVKNTPLTVKYINFWDNAENFKIDDKIYFVFNKKLSTKVLKGGEYSLLSNFDSSIDSGLIVSCNLSFEGKATVILTPTSKLNKGEQYTLFIKHIYSEEGDSIFNLFSRFTTEK
jgi:hypothetical protein